MTFFSYILSFCTVFVITLLILCLVIVIQLSMTSDTGITKEEDDEEDDTMQNTVVLFSNTDKFVLLQVQLVLHLKFELPRGICCAKKRGLLLQIQSKWTARSFCFVFSSHLLFSSPLVWFRTCVLCVVVLERVRRGSCLLVHNVPSVTILTV